MLLHVARIGDTTLWNDRLLDVDGTEFVAHITAGMCNREVFLGVDGVCLSSRHAGTLHDIVAEAVMRVVGRTLIRETVETVVKVVNKWLGGLVGGSLRVWSVEV